MDTAPATAATPVATAPATAAPGVPAATVPANAAPVATSATATAAGSPTSPAPMPVTPGAAVPADVNAPAPTPAATTAPATTAAPNVSFPLKPTTTAQVAKPVGHAAPPQADAGSIGGAVFSLLLVIGLIFALGWLARRMPGLQRGGASSQLKVVASVALGPRERAMVVDVGGTQLLLGVGQGGVRALHVLEQPLPEVDAPSAPSPFAQVLAQHFGRKS